MDKIELLKQEFQKTKIEFGKDILRNISTKTDDEILFPPYIPFVGKNYNEFKILVYSTAQNIKFDWFRNLYQNNFDKLTERLYYFDNFQRKYPKDKMTYEKVAINPYQTGVVASLLGVYIFAKYGKIIKNKYEINDWIGISNYYKFSLNNGKTDINPETEINKYISDNKQIENYYGINDELVRKEIELLKPNIVISFNGRKLNKLKDFVRNKCGVIKINDPSWILQGGSGVFKENKSWWKVANNCNETEIKELVDYYCLNWVKGNYKGKKDSVKIYLLKYYFEWKEE